MCRADDGGGHVAALLGEIDPAIARSRAVDWLANQASADGAGFAARADRISRRELTLFVDALRDRGVSDAELALADRVVWANGQPDRDHLAPLGDEAVWTERIATIASVCGSDVVGAVFVVADDSLDDGDRGARTFVLGLARTVPEIPIAMCVRPGSLAESQILAGKTRDLALLREATIQLDELGQDALEARVAESNAKRVTALDRSISRLAHDGCTVEVADRFAEAAAAPRDRDPSGEHVDRARSAAERFLFARLDTLPETTGQFELNGLLEQTFGASRAEVDLLARKLAIAIEVDGYYHFTDPEAYRRDRRKDLLMQRSGLLVVRVLATDVVDRVDDVLDTILDVVRARRRKRGATIGAK